ncbi:MAG: sigma-70 family RNA polymerase sigma factor [Planctomycetaceae bacterium]|nr:sigma-70 family RNA polymerase sigma factor [Planctomycetaceae bacterium]
MPHSTPPELLARARSGDTQALGKLLELYRNSLCHQARQQLGSRLNSRVDYSDIVQETFLEAQRDFSGFRGECEAEWAGWLNRILENNLAEAVRRHDLVQKRSVRSERSLDDSKSPAGPLRKQLSDNEATPSRRAVQAEETLSLNLAIDNMTADQREVIRLRYMDGLSLKELAQHFDRSEMAVASLLHRAVDRLRGQLSNGKRDRDS